MKYIKEIILKIKKRFTKNKSLKYEPDYEALQRRKMFDALKYWTPELIEWIGKTNDPVKLAVASCLINCHKWPEWVPSKPEWHENLHSNNLHDEYQSRLFFCVEVCEIFEKKSQTISPRLYNKIWLTQYYENY